ncbi:MAG TPA: glycosyl hydrolase, partial [Duganella sp.]
MMVRSNPLFTRGCVAPLTMVLVLALGAGAATASTDAKPAAPTSPAALGQPALVTPKALHAAMLAVGAAGTRLVAAGERGIILYSD